MTFLRRTKSCSSLLNVPDEDFRLLRFLGLDSMNLFGVALDNDFLDGDIEDCDGFDDNEDCDGFDDDVQIDGLLIRIILVTRMFALWFLQQELQRVLLSYNPEGFPLILSCGFCCSQSKRDLCFSTIGGLSQQFQRNARFPPSGFYICGILEGIYSKVMHSRFLR